MTRPPRVMLDLLDEAGAAIDRYAGLPPAKARVYRTPNNGALNPIWVWHCGRCDALDNACPHPPIHHPGTWEAAMCGGFRHVHVEHPRTGPAGRIQHAVALSPLFMRARCDIRTPTRGELALAREVLNRAATPEGSIDWQQARAFAREILALAGYQR